MRFLVAGGTGTVGRALVAALAAEGHAVLATSRHGTPVPGAEAVQWDTKSALQAPGVEAVVNLAGAGVADKRWTKARCIELRDSRVRTTRLLVEWAQDQSPMPSLVSASAVGYYGTAPQGPCTESTPPGTDFLARLCVDWEAQAAAYGGRVAVLRLGHVLARDGGYLGRLLPAARFGLAQMGPGRQAMPWVHADDVARAVLWAAQQGNGPYNVVSPGLVDQRTFARGVVDRAAGPRWPLVRVPALALKGRFGKAAQPLLGGQAAVPVRLQAEGFRFRWPDLGAALDDLVE